jgi:isopentenyl phosphate kinase
MSTPPRAPGSELVFLKLGGSLITDKARPATARREVIERLAGEIAAALRLQPGLRLLLGHGSGSFGHVPASQFGTRQGVATPAQWQGFVEVWRQAAALNRIVMDSLAASGLNAIAFPPSASVTAWDGALLAWEMHPLSAALQAGLLPVVFGDVIFDTVRGGTIFSTEDLFEHLAHSLRPRRILLAGIEPGVWADYPACARLAEEITPRSLPAILPSLSGAQAADVTGGMESKVLQSMALVEQIPGLEVLIFSGAQAGLVQRALLGESPGTRLHNPSHP